MMATSGWVRSISSNESFRVGRESDDLEAGFFEQAGEPFAEDHGVVGEGLRAWDLGSQRGAAARWAGDCEPAAERFDAVGEAAQS